MIQETTQRAAAARICPECGIEFETRHPTKRFCIPAHKQSYANREAAQGKVIASLAKAWRLKRGGKGVGQDAFAELCRILDGFNAEDRAAGRPAATVYVEGLLATGLLYIDRRQHHRDSPDAGGSADIASG